MSHWQDIVQKYTTANLTRCTDVLEALSGVASSMQKWSNGKYLAGLWTENSVDDLLWMSSDKLNHRHPSYTALLLDQSPLTPILFCLELCIMFPWSMDIVLQHTEPFGSGIGRLYQTEGLIITGCTDEFQGESISSDSEKSDFIIPCLNLSLELHYVEESSPISENKQSQLRTAISEMALTWKPYIAVDVVDDWITGTDYLVYCLPIITTRKRESPYFWSGNGDD
jgi:hypothetical protein